MRYKEETLSDNPKIMFYYDVVTDDEIDEIKEQAASMVKITYHSHTCFN